MTNAELIQAIRNEIERLAAEHPIVPFSESYEGGIDAGYASCCCELLSFLSTLESEKPTQEGLEEEIREYMSNEDNNPFDWDWRDKRDCALHFAKWGAEHLANSNDEVVINGHEFAYDKDKDAVTTKPVPADLEEAADVEFDSQVFGKVMSDILAVYKSPSNPEEEPFDYEWTIARQFYELGCRAGAKWDRSRMMQEAVEKTICLVPSLVGPKMFTTSIELSADELKGFDLGDKVRVIVCKKED